PIKSAAYKCPLPALKFSNASAVNKPIRKKGTSAASARGKIDSADGSHAITSAAADSDRLIPASTPASVRVERACAGLSAWALAAPRLKPSTASDTARNVK